MKKPSLEELRQEFEQRKGSFTDEDWDEIARELKKNGKVDT